MVHRPPQERAGAVAETIAAPIAAGFRCRQERASAAIQPVVGIEIKAKSFEASSLVDQVTVVLSARGEKADQRIVRGAGHRFRPRHTVRRFPIVIRGWERHPQAPGFGALVRIVEQGAPDSGSEIESVRERIIER